MVDYSLMAALISIALLNCDRPKLPSEHNCYSSDSQLPFIIEKTLINYSLLVSGASQYTKKSCRDLTSDLRQK